MLYLHIGSHKTGTSSIQETFYANRDRLRSHGVEYFGYAENHSEAMLWRFSAQRFRHPATVNAGLSAGDVNRLSAEVDTQLQAFMREAPAATKVISGEEISVFNPPDVEAINAFFRQFGEPVRILIYVRNYYDFLNSQMQELVKWGWSTPQMIASLESGPGLRPNYRFRIEKFIARFGRDNVDVRIYDPEHLVGGDLLADFCNAIGVPAAVADLDRITVNTSVSARSVRLMSDYNLTFPPTIEGISNPERVEETREYLLQREGPRFRLQDRAALEVFARSVQDDADYLCGLLGEDARVILLRQTADTGAATSEADVLRGDYGELMTAFGHSVWDSVDLARALEAAVRLLEDAPANIGRAETVRAVFRSVESSPPCVRLGRALLDAGRPRLARVAAERAIEIAPDEPAARRLLEDAARAMADQPAARSETPRHSA